MFQSRRAGSSVLLITIFIPDAILNMCSGFRGAHPVPPAPAAEQIEKGSGWPSRPGVADRGKQAEGQKGTGVPSAASLRGIGTNSGTP